MKLVYSKKQFDVYQTDDGFLIHNHDLEGFKHSHVEHLNTCKYLIDLSLKRKVPHDLPRYLMISLERINSDEVYLRKIQELLDNKRRKGYYFNSQKGRR